VDVPCLPGGVHDLNPVRGQYGHYCFRCGVIFSEVADPPKLAELRKHRKSGTTSPHNTLRERDGAQCFYCHRPQSRRRFLTIDHVVPKSKGGSNKLKNCVLACHRCNNEKDDLLLVEWVDRWYSYGPFPDMVS
jgi:hypothetical protein